MAGHTHTDEELAAFTQPQLAHHLHKDHLSGDWRQNDRMSLDRLAERHSDLHGELDHSDVVTSGQWYGHMRARHLTEPVRGSLELVRAQHDLMHPQPGHVGEHTRPDLPGTDMLEQQDGQHQARMDQLLSCAEAYAETIPLLRGRLDTLETLLLALSAYQDIGKLISEGYPLPKAWRS